MKQSLIVFFGLLVLASCRKKEEESGPVAVTSIEVAPATLKLQMSATKQLKAKVNPANATNGEVKWTSSDQAKATVDATGLVTAVAKGTTTITAESVADPSKKAACEVTVTGIFISEITITSPSTAVAVGRDLQLTAAVKPDNAENKEVAWSSDKSEIATVDATGKVTGRAKGSAVITATAKDEGAVNQTIIITVAPAVTSIIILPANPVVGTEATATTTLRATVAPSDAAQAVTWSSEDTNKATIDPTTGVATGVALGTATIIATATDGSGITGRTMLTVKSSNASVTIITLGAENFKVDVPAPGATTTLKNAPRAIASSIITPGVPVNITAADGATIKIRGNAFNSGDNVEFFGPIAFSVTAEDGKTTKTYTVGITPYDASTNPYGVYTVVHLHDVRNAKGRSYQLMNNITLPDNNAAGAAATGIDDYADAGWLPIADDTGDFSGTFDGAGFRIENLYINRTIAVGGLFGKGNRCTIKNLEVRGTTGKTSVTINSSEPSVHVAILIGRITAGTITDCSVTGSVTSNKGSAGGLAGQFSNGSVTNCFSTANISAGSGYAGGLSGSLTGQVSKSYATGEVTAGNGAGGLVGSLVNPGSITDCFVTGKVSSTGSIGFDGSGGLVGINIGRPVTNSYATGDASSTRSQIGGLIGQNFEDSRFTNCYRNSDAKIKQNSTDITPVDASTEGITPKTRAEMQTDDFKGRLNGVSGTIWGRDARNDNLPYIIGVGVGK